MSRERLERRASNRAYLIVMTASRGCGVRASSAVSSDTRNWWIALSISNRKSSWSSEVSMIRGLSVTAGTSRLARAADATGAGAG